MKPSALKNPSDTTAPARQRGWISRLFTRSAADKKQPARKKHTLRAAVAAATLATVAMPTAAEAQRGPTPASIVIDVDNNQVLNAFNADTRVFPASTTKMMTAYLVFEALESGRLRRDQRLTVSANAAAQPRTNLALRRGTTITVDQALRGLLVHSGNDAAVVLGEALGGTREGFERMMDAQARELGMRGTNFFNANGLGNPNQYTTARDMANLLIAIERDFPELYDEYMGVRSFSYNGMSWNNTNRLLDSDQCPGITGGKTGYIRASGSNIVVMAERNDRTVVVAVFGRASAAARNSLTCNLVNYAFFRMVRDPNATYDSDRTYEVVMPPLPTPPQPVPQPGAPVILPPVAPPPVDPTMTPPMTGISPGPITFRSGTGLIQPLFNSSVFAPRALSAPAQKTQPYSLVSQRYSFSFV